MDDGAGTEHLVEPEVGEQVQAAVKEGEEPDQTSVLDEPEDSGCAAQRGDGETAEEQDEGGQSGAVSDAFDRVRAEGSGKGSYDEKSQRSQAGDPEYRLENVISPHRWYCIVCNLYGVEAGSAGRAVAQGITVSWLSTLFSEMWLTFPHCTLFRELTCPMWSSSL